MTRDPNCADDCEGDWHQPDCPVLLADLQADRAVYGHSYAQHQLFGLQRRLDPTAIVHTPQMDGPECSTS